MPEPRLQVRGDDVAVALVGAGTDARLGDFGEPLVKERSEGQARVGSRHARRLGLHRLAELDLDDRARLGQERAALPSAVGQRHDEARFPAAVAALPDRALVAATSSHCALLRSRATIGARLPLAFVFITRSRPDSKSECRWSIPRSTVDCGTGCQAPRRRRRTATATSCSPKKVWVAMSATSLIRPHAPRRGPLGPGRPSRAVGHPCRGQAREPRAPRSCRHEARASATRPSCPGKSPIDPRGSGLPATTSHRAPAGSARPSPGPRGTSGDRTGRAAGRDPTDPSGQPGRQGCSVGSP